MLPASPRLGGMAVPALIYVADQRRRCRALQGLGDPVGHRHRLRARRAGAARAARARLAQGVPAGAGDPRRPRRHRHHRASSTRRTCTGSRCCWRLAGARACCSALNRRGVTRLAPYLLIGVVHLGVRAEIGRARDARRRRRRPSPSRCGRRRRASRRCWSSSRRALHPWVAFGDPAAVRLRQCRRLACRAVARQALLEPVPLGIALGLFARQAARHLRRRRWLAVISGWSPSAGRRDAGPAPRRRHARRHRLHHEPVHRHAGLQRRDGARRRPARRSLRLADLGGGRLHPAACRHGRAAGETGREAAHSR